MSRRIGAYVTYDAASLSAEVKALLAGVEDMSPVMLSISGDMLREGREQARDNPLHVALDPDTIRKKRKSGHPLTIGVGEHGGFAPFMVPFWGKRNAGWKTRAPHAHLFALGTDRWKMNGVSTFRWGSKGKHRSRGVAAGRDGTQWTGSKRQPARPFDYITADAKARYDRMLLAYVTAIHQKAA